MTNNQLIIKLKKDMQMRNFSKKKELPTLELLKKVLGKDFNLCPHCKKGHMLIPNTS